MYEELLSDEETRRSWESEKYFVVFHRLFPVSTMMLPTTIQTLKHAKSLILIILEMKKPYQKRN